MGHFPMSTTMPLWPGVAPWAFAGQPRPPTAMGQFRSAYSRSFLLTSCCRCQNFQTLCGHPPGIPFRPSANFEAAVIAEFYDTGSGVSLLRTMRTAGLHVLAQKLFYFEHPHPLLVEILWGWAPGTLWGWALRGHWLGTSERLWAGHWVWALQKDSEVRDSLALWVGHSNKTLGLGTPRETLGLGTQGTL